MDTMEEASPFPFKVSNTFKNATVDSEKFANDHDIVTDLIKMAIPDNFNQVDNVVDIQD